MMASKLFSLGDKTAFALLTPTLMRRRASHDYSRRWIRRPVTREGVILTTCSCSPGTQPSGMTASVEATSKSSVTSAERPTTRTLQPEEASESSTSKASTRSEEHTSELQSLRHLV